MRVKLAQSPIHGAVYLRISYDWENDPDGLVTRKEHYAQKSALRFARDAQEIITQVREPQDLGTSETFKVENINSSSPYYEQLITAYFNFTKRETETVPYHICNGHPCTGMKSERSVRGWTVNQSLKRNTVKKLWPTKQRFIKRYTPYVKGGPQK